MAPDPAARRRAEVIFQVQAGKMTATAAAAALGVSRKTYYQWEARALRGMLSGLTEQPPGRPPSGPTPKEAALAAEVESLQKEVDSLAQTAELRALLRVMEQNAKKKLKASPKSSP